MDGRAEQGRAQVLADSTSCHLIVPSSAHLCYRSLSASHGSRTVGTWNVERATWNERECRTPYHRRVRRLSSQALDYRPIGMQGSLPIASAEAMITRGTVRIRLLRKRQNRGWQLGRHLVEQYRRLSNKSAIRCITVCLIAMRGWCLTEATKGGVVTQGYTFCPNAPR